MYGLRNSEMSTCLFQFSHKTRQTMLLYAYFTLKIDFKCRFNHHQSFLYEWRLTARMIRKLRIGPSIRIESRIGRTIRNRIESRSFAGPKLKSRWLLLLCWIWSNSWSTMVSLCCWNDRRIIIIHIRFTHTNCSTQQTLNSFAIAVKICSTKMTSKNHNHKTVGMKVNNIW